MLEMITQVRVVLEYRGIVRRLIPQTLRNRLRNKLHLLQDGLRPLVRWRSPQERFFIFAQARTGSTVLTSLLNCHPEIFCDGEILAPHQGRFRWLNYRVACRSRLARTKGKRVYGFNVKISQLARDRNLPDPGTFIRSLNKRGWRVIHVRRANVLRQVLSNRAAMRRGRYHVAAAEKIRLADEAPLTVDVDGILQGIAAREALQLQEAKALEGVDYLALHYESDLLHPDSHQATANRVFEFLGLESTPVRAGLVRTGKDELSAYVANHEELLAALLRDGYERFAE